MSDNGGFSTATRWRDEPLHTQNYPLNSGKGSAYEGGVRVPMIVKWPGVVEFNTKCNDYLIIEDFFPTILDMALVEDRETKQEIDGVSFMNLLKDNHNSSNNLLNSYVSDDKNRNLYWNFPNLWGNSGPGIGPTCTIRSGDWKLIYYYETGEKELFNITNHIGESVNHVNKEPKLVKRLSKELGEFLRSVDAQRPSFKATGKECPWPDEI